MKVVWLSANRFGFKLLKEAIGLKDVSVEAIVTLSENAKTKMYDGLEVEAWEEFGLPVHAIENVNNEVELLEKLSPDAIVMCGWRQVLSEKVLKIPKKGIVAFHPSLLPEGRGPAPVINTILNGLKQSGVTMFYADNGTDSGDVIGRESFNISESDYAADVYEKVVEAGKRLIKKFLPLLVKGSAPREKQDKKKASYFEKITLEDNEIKADENAETTFRKVRAFSRPYAGAFVKVGNRKLRIWEAELDD